MTDDHDLNLTVGHIPTSHTVVGYVAYLKVLDEDGDAYYAQRTDGLGDMEMLGMATALADDFKVQIRGGREHVEGD